MIKNNYDLFRLWGAVLIGTFDPDVMKMSLFVFVVDFDDLAQASDIRIERRVESCLPLLNAGFEPRVSDIKSPADWMPADKPTKLLRIKLKAPSNSALRLNHHQKFKTSYNRFIEVAGRGEKSERRQTRQKVLNCSKF